jgi:RHS repeat-associated protein
LRCPQLEVRSLRCHAFAAALYTGIWPTATLGKRARFRSGLAPHHLAPGALVPIPITVSSTSPEPRLSTTSASPGGPWRRCRPRRRGARSPICTPIIWERRFWRRTRAAEWSGGPFELFGRDWQEGMAAAASENVIFLRFPGQWDDGRWSGADAGAGVYYNLHRWYEAGTGRYTRNDPLGFEGGDPNTYSYARAMPTVHRDRLGLAIRVAPELAPFVECAKQERFFAMAWQWFEGNGDWTMRPIDSWPKRPLVFGQTMPLDRDSGLPDCDEGGRILPDDRTGQLPRGGGRACGLVVKSIAHEIVETWAHCYLGMGATAAHTFTQRGPAPTSNGLDDDVADQGCSSCACLAALSSP